MALNVTLVPSEDRKLSKAEILRGVVADKLTTAAREIFAVVERTVAGYEEEASGLREEVGRQRKLLEVLIQPRVTLRRTDAEDSRRRDVLGRAEEEEGDNAEDSRRRDVLGHAEEEEGDNAEDSRRRDVLGHAKEEEGDNAEDSRRWDVLGHAEEEEGDNVEDSRRRDVLGHAEEEEGDNAEDSGRRDVLGHAEEEEGEDEEKESPVQSTSLNQEYLRNLDHQIPNTRVRSLRRKYKKKTLNLRVCLLQDSQTHVFKSPVLPVRCPRGLQEQDFVALLRSTFPQLTGPFDAFTADITKKLRPLKLQTLTPEEIQRSIKSVGKGRSALYIRGKGANKSPKSTKHLPPPQRTAEATDDTRSEENRTNASPAENMERNEADGLSIKSRRRRRRKTDRDAERRGISEADDFTGLSSQCSEAESKGDHGDVEGDEDWKPGVNDEETREAEKTTRRRGVRASRSKRKKLSGNGEAPLACKLCQAVFGSSNMLIKHAWSHVDDLEKLCGVCGRRSESAEELRSHLQSHQKLHSCNICGKSFLTAVSRDHHTNLHTGERPYKCDICQKTFTHRSSWRIHRWEHVEEKPHKCDFCNRSFGFQNLLRIHRRSHTGEKPHCCDVCSKSFTSFRSLSRHKLLHTGEKRHSCQVCGKRFTLESTLREHMTIHTLRDKTHLCDVCCKTFYTGSALRVHLRTHSEEKVTCGECGVGLSSGGALKRHMMIHTGERPYECSECGQTFNSRSTLKGHLRTHSGIKPFVCKVCGKACSRQEHLKVHMRTHNGERPYQCALCDKAFTQGHCLKTHMKSHQGEVESAVGGLQS